MKASISSLACGTFILAAVLILVPGTAHAYLDPGSGSYLIQLLIGALLGAAFAVKMFWLRIRTFFSNLLTRKPKGD